jgi:hypothetical protein
MSITVYEIKRKSAELIDMCEPLKSRDPRCAALAQTAYEEAAMWAVKAATAGSGTDVAQNKETVYLGVP